MCEQQSHHNFGPIWDKILKELERVSEKYDIPVKLAIVGFSKAGKSTLFNAIYGKDIQEVGAQTDLTTKTKEVRRFGIIFTDSPGMGTRDYQFDDIKKIIETENPHLVMHCINGMGGISQDDADLYDFCKETQRNIIVAVTKADVMKEREMEEFKESILKKLDSSVNPIFVSAETGLNMPELIQLIHVLLPQAARDAFIARQTIDLNLKQKKARAAIHSTAVAAAAVAVSPIPVSDVMILIPMQAALVVSIGKIYGYKITSERAKEILAVAGGGVVLRYAFQILVKFLPGIGSFIGPVIAYGGTVAIGEAALAYFKSGMKATPEEIAEVYQRARENAKREFKDSDKAEKIKENEERLKHLREQLENGDISQEEFEKKTRELLEE